MRMYYSGRYKKISQIELVTYKDKRLNLVFSQKTSLLQKKYTSEAPYRNKM